MIPLLTADYFFAIAALSAALVLAVLFYKKKLRAYPWFAALQVITILECLTVMLVQPRAQTISFYAQNAFDLGEHVLEIVVIFGIWRDVLKASVLPVSRSRFLRWNAYLLLLGALYCGSIPIAQTVVWYRAIYILKLVVYVLQTGLLGSLLALSIFFGFYWNRMNFGIALGYGLIAITGLVGLSVRTVLGPSWHSHYATLVVLTGDAAVLIWLVYAWRSDRVPSVELSSLPLQQWESMQGIPAMVSDREVELKH
jgi:hypothetical protein